MVNSKANVAFPSSLWYVFPSVLFAVVTCGDPGTPSNGQRQLSDQNFGTEVNYTCSEGHELEGSQRRTCQARGEWSGQLPQCKSKCHVHTHPCIHTHTHTHTSTHAQHMHPPMHAVFSHTVCTCELKIILRELQRIAIEDLLILICQIRL